MEAMTLEQVRDDLRTFAGDMWAMPLPAKRLRRLADAIDANLAQPVGDDTRRLQFVLDHVPHSVLADFGVLPENWMELAEGEAHIDDARACIDAQLPASPTPDKEGA